MTNKKCECCGREINKAVIQIVKAKKLEWGKVSDKTMNWSEAVRWCESQGEGWRLPTEIELLQAFNDKIEGFKHTYFWSSIEGYSNITFARIVALDTNYTSYYTNYGTKTTAYDVRCVRSL